MYNNNNLLNRLRKVDTMNQAEKIRNIVVSLLKGNSEITDEIVINEERVRAVQYANLKKYLVKKYPEFTEGGVTGALQTLTKRVDNVFKTKTKDGVFFFYSEEQDIISNSVNKVVAITDSEDYMKLEKKVEEVSSAVGEILRNAGKGKYLAAENLDISYLRDILEGSENLQGILREYKKENAFERIKVQNPGEENPFSNDLSKDDLPF